MSCAQKLLISSGLILSILGMGYGLYFALFDEHQTHEALGVSLATGFSKAAEDDLNAAHDALDRFADAQFEYTREVHAHSHIISLGMLLIILGMAFKQLAYKEQLRWYLAIGLVLGSTLFPLGVLLQTFHAGLLTKGLTVFGTIAVLCSFTLVAFGFIKKKDTA